MSDLKDDFEDSRSAPFIIRSGDRRDHRTNPEASAITPLVEWLGTDAPHRSVPLRFEACVRARSLGCADGGFIVVCEFWPDVSRKLFGRH